MEFEKQDWLQHLLWEVRAEAWGEYLTWGGQCSLTPWSWLQHKWGDSTQIIKDSVQFSSVQSLSRVWLCDPMNCSTPGLPVHHQHPEFTQTHVHWVSDAIQPSHPLSPFSSCLQCFPPSGSFQISQPFTSGGQSIGVSASTSVLPMNTQDWIND